MKTTDEFDAAVRRVMQDFLLPRVCAESHRDMDRLHAYLLPLALLSVDFGSPALQAELCELQVRTHQLRMQLLMQEEYSNGC
jgi:hypothetical protein